MNPNPPLAFSRAMERAADAVIPEQRLILGVINQAAHDLYYRRPDSEWQDAADFFAMPSRHADLCHAVGLEPEYVQRCAADLTRYRDAGQTP